MEPGDGETLASSTALALARLALTAPDRELAHAAAMALARVVIDLADDDQGA